MSGWKWVVLFFMVWAKGSFAFASTPPANILFVEPKIQQHKLVPHQIVPLKIKMTVVENHYLYLDNLKLVWPENFPAKNTSLRPSVSKKIFDKFAKKDKIIVEGSFEVETEFEVPENAEAKYWDLPLGVRYQACSTEYCLLPKTKFSEISFEIIREEEPLKEPSRKLSEPNLFLFETALEKGWFFTFLFVFFAGILTSFTPCVFPMIPITLAVIGSRAAHISKLQSFLISLSYVLGIALTYAMLGLFAAKTGALFGSLLSNPLVVGLISGMLLIMSLSMFGLFEIKTPDYINQKLMTKKTGQGFRGAFFAGLIAGVVASPCVGPVLVGILAYVAKSQSMLLGFSLLFTFALGLGVLFLVLGTFSSLVHYLPKSGPWMNVTKFIFGFSMIAMAIYFAIPVIPHAWIASIIGFATALLGFILGFQIHEDKKRMFYRRSLGLIAILLGFGLILVSALDMVKKENKPKIQKSTMKNWHPLDSKSIESSQQKGRAVLIDFKAEWCAACKELEINTFSTPEFEKATENIDLYYVDATHQSAEVNQWIEKFGILGLPTVIFIDSQGKQREDLRLTGFEEFSKFKLRLDSLSP